MNAITPNFEETVTEPPQSNATARMLEMRAAKKAQSPSTPDQDRPYETSGGNPVGACLTAACFRAAGAMISATIDAQAKMHEQVPYQAPYEEAVNATIRAFRPWTFGFASFK